jgi:hypothetical protein
MQVKKLIVPVLCPDFVVTLGPYIRKSFGMYGGDDGARTRDLCRDSLAFSGFSTTYKPVGNA